MTRKDAVLLIDPTAKVHIWGTPENGQGFWVKGAGWETKVTYSEERAWEIALLQITEKEVA